MKVIYHITESLTIPEEKLEDIINTASNLDFPSMKGCDTIYVYISNAKPSLRKASCLKYEVLAEWSSEEEEGYFGWDC